MMQSKPTPVVEQRNIVVGKTLDAIRRTVLERGVNREALEQIKETLIELAGQSALFPRAHFPVPGTGKGFIYRLFDDVDAGLALYASAGVPGKYQPPHNHTTWAAIAAVYGDEHNVLYERTDNGATPGHGTLRRTGELTVCPGNAVALMPDDFHTIEVTSAEPSLHLHVYGRSLERLPGRIYFQTPESETYATFPANPNIRTPVIPPRELRDLMLSPIEHAVLDVREERIFAEAHLLTASSAPLSSIELRVPAMVPRRSTPIVLCDATGELANRAATLLVQYGYRNLCVLDGGIEDWKQSGLATYAGMHVPSKAFGEYVELREKTPSITAGELSERLAAGEPMTVVDCRPNTEFRKGTLPGAINCIGVDLLPAVLGHFPTSDTTVVVHCAGRTRGIIGAQTLLDGDIKNPVVVLEDGTMGWRLAGHPLHEMRDGPAPFPSTKARRAAGAASSAIGRRGKVRYLDEEGLAVMQAQAGKRTLYLVDVRSTAEYETGHRQGARSIPGGQLLQATDSWFAVRGARIVLTDDDGIRATITAAWLNRMGFPEVYVLGAPWHRDWLETGPEPRKVLGLGRYRVSWIDADELARRREQKGDVEVVDLATGPQYRDGHLSGAWLAVRDGLSSTLKQLPAHELVVLTSPDGVLASIVAAELDSDAVGEVQVLLGGTAAWSTAGHALEDGDGRGLSPINDVYLKPYQRAGDQEKAMRDYLAWEKNLLDEIYAAGDDELLTFLPQQR